MKDEESAEGRIKKIKCEEYIFSERDHIFMTPTPKNLNRKKMDKLSVYEYAEGGWYFCFLFVLLERKVCLGGGVGG